MRRLLDPGVPSEAGDGAQTIVSRQERRRPLRPLDCGVSTNGGLTPVAGEPREATQAIGDGLEREPRRPAERQVRLDEPAQLLRAAGHG